MADQERISSYALGGADAKGLLGIWNRLRRFMFPQNRCSKKLDELRRQGEQVVLPAPSEVHEHPGCMSRLYRLRNGLEFVLISPYPDTIPSNCVVPESEPLGGMFAGENALQLQSRLERENVLAGLPSVRWFDAPNYGVKRVFEVQARDAARLLDMIGSLTWQPSSTA